MGIYDDVEQVEDALVLDLAPQLCFQDVMVDALVILPRIHFQNVDRHVWRVFQNKPYDPFHSLVNAALLDPGIGVFDERLCQVSSRHALYGVLNQVVLVARIPMDDPNFPPVVAREHPVSENAPPILDKFPVELSDVISKVLLETKHLKVSSLVLSCFSVCFDKVLDRNDLIECVSKSFHLAYLCNGRPMGLPNKSLRAAYLLTPNSIPAPLAGSSLHLCPVWDSVSERTSAARRAPIFVLVFDRTLFTLT